MNRSASADEAAAIAAAISRFQAESTPPPAADEAIGAWQGAALAEGVGAKGALQKLLERGGDRWQS